MKKRLNNRGVVLVYVMVLLMFMGFVAVAMSTVATNNMRQSANARDFEQSYYIAESTAQVAYQTLANEMKGVPFATLGGELTDKTPEDIIGEFIDTINTLIYGYNSGDTVLSVPPVVINDSVAYQTKLYITPIDNDAIVFDGTPGIVTGTLSPAIVLSYRCEGREATISGNIDIDYKYEFTAGQTITGEEVVRDLISSDNGAAYFKGNGGNADDNGESFYNGAPTFGEEFYKEYFGEDAYNDLMDDEGYVNIKNAEYIMLTDVIRRLFSDAGELKADDILDSTEEERNNTSVWKGSLGTSNTHVKSASTINNMSSSNTSSNLEYLEVTDNLIINGDVNLSKLKGIYVSGDLTINSGVSFTGSPNITDIYVGGTLTMNGNCTVDNAQFFVKNQIIMNNAKNTTFKSNSVFIVFGLPGTINLNNGKGNNFGVGSSDHAPQFYAAGDIIIYSQGSEDNTHYYGVFATLSENGMLATGSSTATGYHGLVIGLNSEVGKNTPRSSGIDKNSLINSAFMDILDDVIDETLGDGSETSGGGTTNPVFTIDGSVGDDTLRSILETIDD